MAEYRSREVHQETYQRQVGDGQVNVSPYKTDAVRSNRGEVVVTRNQDRPMMKTRIKKSTLKCFLGQDRRFGL